MPHFPENWKREREIVSDIVKQINPGAAFRRSLGIKMK